jgi:GxxExxY protein
MVANSTDLNEVTGQIVDAAVKLHKGLGPGLLESVYESILARDLERRGFISSVRSWSHSSTTA